MLPDSPSTRASSGRFLIGLSVLLILIGATGIVLYVVGAPDQLAEGTALGGLRGGLIIISALATAGGVVAALLAVLRRRNRARRAPE